MDAPSAKHNPFVIRWEGEDAGDPKTITAPATDVAKLIHDPQVTPGGPVKWELVTGTGSTNNALVNIEGDGTDNRDWTPPNVGEITFKAASVAGTYSIRVKATDLRSGETKEKVMSIVVNAP